MVDLRMPEQWTVEKSYNRSHHNESPSSTSDLDDSDRIRLTRSTTMPMPTLEAPSMLQDRYLSSEEDLSPTVSDSAEQSDDNDSDDDEEVAVEIVEATTIVQPATAANGKLARAVSYVSAGRAKVVNMSETQSMRERTFSVPAVASAVPILKSPVPRMSRMSFGNYRAPATTIPEARISNDAQPATFSPVAIPPKSERRKSSMPTRERPSLSRSPLSYDPSTAPPLPTPTAGSLRSSAKVARHYSLAAPPSHNFLNSDRPKLLRSSTDLRATLAPSPPPLPVRSRSTEPTSPILERPPVLADAELRRPSSVRSSYSPSSKRASVHARQRSGSFQLPAFAPAAAPLTPLTPETPNFLNIDPFAKKEENKTEDNGKPAHRRLRSISRTLSLARIALVPQNKRGSTWGKSKGKADKNHRDSMDVASPISPMTQVNVAKDGYFPMPSPLAPNMPPTPITPGTPIPTTPNTAVFSPRTSSRLSNNTPEEEEMQFPPRTSSLAARPRLVARPADEREPPMQLPPFPDADDDVRMPGRRRLTKRKSLLGIA